MSDDGGLAVVWYVDIGNDAFAVDDALVVDDSDTPELPVADVDLVRNHLVREIGRRGG